MTSNHAQRITALIAVAALLATLFIGLYMARPWSESAGYTGMRDYFGLLLFLVFACTPHIYLLLRARKPASRVAAFTRLAIAVVVGLGAIAIMVDTAFINLDAQGGLLFLVLPVYQWLIIAVVEVVAGILDRGTKA